jgi:hypothetical protein
LEVSSERLRLSEEFEIVVDEVAAEQAFGFVEHGLE